QADRIGVARRMASELSATVVLKGYRSIVAAPDGRTAVITTGGPALATGGTGDVLTGVTAALLAGGPTAGQPYQAAWAASWIHGRAGDLLGDRIGSRGALAGDLPEAVAGVMHELEGRE
ncbi:MAG TPA: NAD(P)H-hydrate dehydratase, partial [Actinomycetota bacterium]|nr:NAD(P)H-hydrate dehydratase [Actinomycetota bacterium]